MRLAQSLQFGAGQILRVCTVHIQDSGNVQTVFPGRGAFKQTHLASGHVAPFCGFLPDQPAERPVKRAYFIPVFPNVRFEAGRIHIADTEKQRGWLHIAVLHAPKFKFYARACSNVCVAAAVDHNFGTKQKQAGFIGGYDTGDAAVFLQYIYKLGVQQQLCTAFSKHLCTYQFKALMVKGANMGVADLIKAGKRFFRLYIGRINGAAQSFHTGHNLLKDTPDDHFFVLCVIAGHKRTDEAGCGLAAYTSVLIKHKGPGPIAGRTDSGADTGGAGADYQNVYIFSNG